MFYKQLHAIHCVLGVRSFGSRPDPSSITQLLFGWDWDLYSAEVCIFPLWVCWEKSHDPWGLASSGPYFSQLSSSVCSAAGSWFFVIFHMLCLPYFTLSKGAPQLCTFACFGGFVAPFLKKAPCNPARSQLEKISISFPAIYHSFWVETRIL